MPNDQRPNGTAGSEYAERLTLQRRLLDQMRALRARLDPEVLQEARRRAGAVPTDRKGIERTVALFLAARKDDGRLMRDIFAELQRHLAPRNTPRRSR